MSIRKITDGEIAKASVARLSDRPNESGGYGKSALTASELRAAFDALGKLCAARYNELCDALTGGSAAKDILVGDKSLEEIFGSVDEKADAETVAEGFLEVDGVLRSLAAESEALKKLTAQQGEALLHKLDTARYLETPAVKGGETVKTTVYPFETSFPIEKNGEGFVIRKGASVPVGSTVAVALVTFPIVKGERYCVYTKEAYPARYYADTGDELHTHIIDGMRLRVTVDTRGDGTEGRLYKITNRGSSHKRLRYTSEPICFTAEENAVAVVALSIYNMQGKLAPPYTDKDAPLTVCVSRVPPEVPLTLDRDMEPSYSEKEAADKGDTLLSVPLPDGDAFGDIGLPVTVSGAVACLHIREGYEILAAYDGEGARIIKGSHQPCGMWYDLALGEFYAIKGRKYRVFTRESHLLGEHDGWYLAVFDGVKTHRKNEIGSDTRTGFVFTAERSGRHKVVMHTYCDDMLVPETYTEDQRISAFVIDATVENKSESLSGNSALSEGENEVVSVVDLPSGKEISSVESIGVRLMGCHAGDGYRIVIEDGNGKQYTETHAVSGSVEIFVLDTLFWTARVMGSSTSEKTLVLPFGRERYPATNIKSVRVIYQAASPGNLRYTVYTR